MNKILSKEVSYPLAKLLKEKEFDERCSHYYINDFQNFKHDGKLYKTGLPNNCDSENIFQFVKRNNQPHLCSVPTIGQVIDWIYEKHKIWISVNKEVEGFDFIIDNKYGLGKYQKRIDSPAEAYEEAIKNVLINN
jgi:hypothetical protein